MNAPLPATPATDDSRERLERLSAIATQLLDRARACLAAEAGLDRLDERHWLVIRYLREYYGANGRAPLNSALRKGTGMALLDLEALFPGGIRDGARRLSGLPNPKTCS